MVYTACERAVSSSTTVIKVLIKKLRENEISE